MRNLKKKVCLQPQTFGEVNPSSQQKNKFEVKEEAYLEQYPNEDESSSYVQERAFQVKHEPSDFTKIEENGFSVQNERFAFLAAKNYLFIIKDSLVEV